SGNGVRTGRAGSHRSRKLSRAHSENGRATDGKSGCAARETFVHQRSARQRTHDRDRVSRAERVQAQDGLETSAQDRQGAVRANGGDTNAEQAPHSHAGGWSCDGRNENSAATHHWRKRSRYVRERARRRADGVPQIPGPNVGTRKQFRESRARFTQICCAAASFGVASASANVFQVDTYLSLVALLTAFAD